MLFLKNSSPCWCGSNKCYGECHKPIEAKIKELKKQGNIVCHKKLMKTQAQIQGVTGRNDLGGNVSIEGKKGENP